MKNAIYFIGLAFALLLAAASCQKAPFLTFNGQKSFTFKDTGGSETITFSCNRAWTAKSSESWLTVSPAQGDANEEGVRVTITCAANTTYDPRNATVTIMSEGLTETITIEQEQKDAIIVNENIYSFPSTGGTATIKGSANVDVLIEIPSEYSSWISAPQTKGLVDFSRDVIVQPNDTYVDREATIYVTEKKSNIRQAVTIKEAQLDYVQLCDKELAANRVDTTIVMKVKYNIDFTPAIDADWISLEPATFTMEGATRGADGLVEAELNVKVKENPSYTYRVSHITNDFGSAPSVSTITQSPFGFLLFENFYYKTVMYNGKEWMVDNLRAKYGQENNPAFVGRPIWEEGNDGALKYSHERLLEAITYFPDGQNYQSGGSDKTICPEGWHMSSVEDWEGIFSLSSDNSAIPFIMKKYDGTDEFTFGGEYGEWHTSSFWLELYLAQPVAYWAEITNSGVFTRKGSVGDAHYPDYKYRYIRCVRGPVTPVIQTLPVCKQTTNSAELRFDILNDPKTNLRTGYPISENYAKITKVSFRYGVKKDDLAFNISSTDTKTTVELTGLNPGTVYYYQPVIEYEGGNSPVCGDVMSFKTHDGTIEHQGKTYYTTIFNGIECMTQNLQATSLNDGAPISYVKENSDWSSATGPAQCISQNDESLLEPYGRLYNRNAIESGKICPEGWRLPSRDDIMFSMDETLEIFGVRSGVFCAADNTYWRNPVYCNNLSGFSALPSGLRQPDGNYWEVGMECYIWTNNISDSQQYSPILIRAQMGADDQVELPYIAGYILQQPQLGASVRCVRDVTHK